jgi:multidrug transporter EmrE-like cation transporter
VLQVFTPWGMLSGALFVSSTGCTFFAIDLLGVSVASAIWCGTAMLASYIWGLRCDSPLHAVRPVKRCHVFTLARRQN